MAEYVTLILLIKVPLIGISNWALDPAKMNRGILVQRDVPDIRELEETALYVWVNRYIERQTDRQTD